MPSEYLCRPLEFKLTYLMKNILRIFTLLTVVSFAAVAFTACGGDDDGKNKPAPGTMTADKYDLSFTSGNYYSQIVHVTAEGSDWDAQADAAWVHVEKKLIEGTQNGTVTVTVDKNTGAARSANIKLSGKNVEPILISVAQKKAFESEIAGRYTPNLIEYNEQMTGDFFLDSEWTNGMGPMLPVNIPQLGGQLPWYMVDAMIVPLVQSYYKQGLASFTFRDDGTLAAEYHVMSGDFLGPTFDPAISQYPTAETLEVLPADAFGYYTENGMVYFYITKAYLTKVGEEMFEVPDLCTVIEELLAAFPGLTLVSTSEFYAMPFKYSVEGNVMTLKVDREMMLPYKPVINELLIPVLLSMADAEMLADFGIDPTKPEVLTGFFDELFDTSTKLDIGVRLTK